MDKILKTIRLIEKQVREFKIPWVTQVSKRPDPYRVLISCILSLRTKDKTTTQATKRLFKVTDNPKRMVKLAYGYLKRLIYPVGFYRNKARVILEISRKLIEDFKSKVPKSREELLAFKGVGRKTANLVLGLGYQFVKMAETESRPRLCLFIPYDKISTDSRIGRRRSCIKKWVRVN